MQFWTIMLVIAMILSMIASFRVNSTFKKYSTARTRSGITGAQTAAALLQANGIYDVQIQRVSGSLTDHFDPTSKTLRLSDSVYGSSSIAAVAVAAHECGHAMQHHFGYAPINIRGALVPVANFGSKISWILIMLGLAIGGSGSLILLKLGILLFSAAVAFQIVTLPVEFNASARAMEQLEQRGLLYAEELKPARKVLSAAAMTYVAAAATSIIQLLRLISIMNRRR